MLKDNLPLDVAQIIISIPISQHGHVDKIIWGGTEVLLLVPSLLNMRTNSLIFKEQGITNYMERNLVSCYSSQAQGFPVVLCARYTSY